MGVGGAPAQKETVVPGPPSGGRWLWPWLDSVAIVCLFLRIAKVEGGLLHWRNYASFNRNVLKSFFVLSQNTKARLLP
jgi:hypothetical protein